MKILNRKLLLAFISLSTDEGILGKFWIHSRH